MADHRVHREPIAASGVLATDPVATDIWRQRYRAAGEHGIEASWDRVARALARFSGADAPAWRARFRAAMDGFHFIPGGRILAGAGRSGSFTLQSCFVLGEAGDGAAGLARLLSEAARTLERGGGIGCDFSPLRPAGETARRDGALSPGPLGAMRTLDAMCANLFTGCARPGAMMATLRVDHPDVHAFIAAKRTRTELRRFNLSLLASDSFMRAASTDQPWPLLFPARELARTGVSEGVLVERPYGANGAVVPCRVLGEVKARELLHAIAHAAWEHAEPGMLFVDRINAENNLHWCERIAATNPCGEEPLPPHGACNLGSVNLTRFVRDPFTPRARLDLPALEDTAAVAVHLLDAVVDASRFALPAQRREAKAKRRLGLGVTGLASAMVMLGLRYDSDAGRAFASATMRRVTMTAYRTSVALARARGPFPRFAAEPYLAGAFVSRLPADIRDAIARDGIRNSHLISIAPAGTISVLAGNVSSGVEPVFAAEYRRRLRQPDGGLIEVPVLDRAVSLWRHLAGDTSVPPALETAARLGPEAHLAMQAALQPSVDAAISKTINLPQNAAFEDCAGLFHRAWSLGLKGCTVFRPNTVTGAVLTEAFSCAVGAGCEPA